MTAGANAAQRVGCRVGREGNDRVVLAALDYWRWADCKLKLDLLLERADLHLVQVRHFNLHHGMIQGK